MKSGEIMDNIRIDLNRLPKLIVGFIIMSTGIAFIQMSSLGLFPWGVLHDGLHVQTGLSFGEVTQILGLIVLVAVLAGNIMGRFTVFIVNSIVELISRRLRRKRLLELLEGPNVVSP